MEWLLSFLGSGILDTIGKSFITPFLNVWMKSKDVDLAKYQASSTNATDLAVAILDANNKFEAIKANYALSVLQWWPFRLILFALLAVASTRFCLIMIDSTWWWVEGCTINGVQKVGNVCAWGIPALHGDYGRAEFEYILFFVIAKPIDSAVTGTLGLVGKYLNKE